MYGTGLHRDASDQSPRAESGLTGLQEQRLIAQALKRGWLRGQQFATNAAEQDFGTGGRPLVANDAALRAAIQGVSSPDQRVRQAAVANIVAMEMANARLANSLSQAGQIKH